MKNIALTALLLGMTAGVSAETGVALMKGTTEPSTIGGTVAFEDTKAGLKVTATLTGVPPGVHGFHIHEFGDCADSGKAAGAHYNPGGGHHGQVVKEGLQKAHAGDMGNITAAADGSAALEITISKAALSGGRYDVAGRAVILHEKADDFSQPAGNAGGRIGCGVVVITPPAPAKK